MDLRWIAVDAKDRVLVLGVILLGVVIAVAGGILRYVYSADLQEWVTTNALRTHAGITSIPDDYTPETIIEIAGASGVEEIYGILPTDRGLATSDEPKRHVTAFIVWRHWSLALMDFDDVLDVGKLRKLWPPIGEKAKETKITLSVGGEELPAFFEEFRSDHGRFVRYRCKLRSGPGLLGTWLIAYGPSPGFDDQSFRLILNSVSFENVNPLDTPFKTSQWGKFGEWAAAKSHAAWLVFSIIAALIFFFLPHFVFPPISHDKHGYWTWGIWSFMIIAMASGIMSIGHLFFILRAIF